MLYPLETATRELKSLDGLWRLCFDPEHRGVRERYFDGIPREGALEVAVPGSLNEQLTEREQYLNLDWVWYELRFRVPASWQGRRIFLRFGAVTYRADVFLNGQQLASHEGGYTPFEVELTSVARPGSEQLLVVRVDSLLSATTLPQGGLDPKLGGVAAWRAGNNPDVHWDFFPFMGIHRPVALYATGGARIAGVRLETLALHGSDAKLRARIRVDGAAERVRLRVPELGADLLGELSGGVVELEFALSGVTPWSPSEPKLYEVELRLESAGALADDYSLPFGIRTVRVEDGKLLLNGEPVTLRGFGKHEDIPIVGRGLSLPHLVKDLGLMRWVGANSFRTSHYPYAEEVLRQADRHGILVIDEAAANTLSMRAVADPAARAALLATHRAHVQELVERDANYACVVAWSLGNECETELESGGYYAELVRHAKQLDATRPVLFVVNSDPAAERAAHDFDLIGVNLYPAWYQDCGKLEAIGPALERVLCGFWARFKKPILICEFGADAVAGMHSELPLMWSEEYQQELIERVLDAASRYPYVVGAHVWNFADFKVGQHPGRALLNHKGVFTRDRTPKMAAHALRRRWLPNRS